MESLVLPLIIYLLPAFILLYLAIEIYMRNRKSPDHRLAAFLIFCLMMWFLADYLRALLPLPYSRWIVINGTFPISFLSMGVSFHLFAKLSGAEKRIPPPVLYLLSYIPVVAITLICHQTDWIYRDFVQYGMWKKTINGPGYLMAIGFAAFYTMVPVYLLGRARRKLASPRKRKQLGAFMAGVTMVVVWVMFFSIVPEIFIPEMKESLPVMMVFGTLFWAGSLRIVLVKYDHLPSYERRFQTLYQLFPSAILLLDGQTKIREANGHAEALLGVQEGSRLFGDLVEEKERDAFLRDYRDNFSRRVVIRSQELTIRLGDGTQKYVLADSDFVEMEDEWLQMIILRDISASKENEKKLMESERRYRETASELEIVMRSTSDGIYTWRLDTGDIIWSDRMRAIFQPKLGDLPPRIHDYGRKVHPDDLPQLKRFMTTIEERAAIQIEHRLLGADGDYLWVYVTGEVICDESGMPIQVIGSMTDITERKKAEAKISHLAYHDPLTGLYNRLYFSETLDRMIAAAAHNCKSLAVLLIDLDRFKVLNDNWGHQQGDKLLVDIAGHLKRLAANGDHSFVARIGGDEFVIVLGDLKDVKQAEELAVAVIGKTTEPYHVMENHYFYYGASIGISVFPQHGLDSETLIRNADLAMYASKEAGRGAYCMYSADMASRMSRMMILENELRGGWEKGDFELHYQPQMNLRTRKVIGAEALIRWKHAERLKLSTQELIVLAEESGFMVSIGDWVLRTACLQGRQWIDHGFPSFSISVNVSGRQLQDNQFAERVMNILEETGYQPDRLCLEITETSALQNLDAAAAALRRLSEWGVRVSIDDFGVGYSSLNAIKRLPIREVKIDQSFIRDIAHNQENAAIVKALIAMGQSMGLSIMAEGIEDEKQLKYLLRMGGLYGQGYGLGKPLDALSFEKIHLHEMSRQSDELAL